MSSERRHRIPHSRSTGVLSQPMPPIHPFLNRVGNPWISVEEQLHAQAQPLSSNGSQHCYVCCSWQSDASRHLDRHYIFLLHSVYLLIDVLERPLLQPAHLLSCTVGVGAYTYAAAQKKRMLLRQPEDILEAPHTNLQELAIYCLVRRREPTLRCNC
mmetsp:Transcript_22954/g.52524  ORF Transcript_22954/g.52524 Transcript_22954/m.52524 type:complete len:157 (+) Transcript_22954:124-594(+)